jgi:nicotinic acid mononucleotide adenylyltransferase
LPKWREVERIFTLARPCVVLRSGGPGEFGAEIDALEGQLSDALLAALRAGFCSPDPVDLAATELRLRFARDPASAPGEDVGLPPGVAAYIRDTGLYRVDAQASDEAAADRSANSTSERRDREG